MSGYRCLGLMLTVMSALTITSVGGLYLGYPEALLVWFIPLAFSFECDDDE